MAHQAGQSNVVGTIGTALTDRHAEMLKRIAHRIILSLDPDTAGDMAALKGSEVLQEHAEKLAIPIRGERGLMGVERRSEIEIRIMQLPRGIDPDELLLAPGGTEQWSALLKDALPLVDHVIGVVSHKYDISTARGKSDAVTEIASFIRELGDAVQRAHYEQRIASVLRVSEQAVQEAVARARNPQKKQAAREQSFANGSPDDQNRADIPQPSRTGLPAPLDSSSAPEEHLLGLALKYPQVTWMAGAPVPEDFTRVENRLIFETLSQVAAKSDQSGLDGEALRNETRKALDPTLAAHIDRLIARSTEPELFRFALPYELEDRLKRLREHNDRMWQQQCQFMMQEAQETGDADTIKKLLPVWSRSLFRFQHYQPKPSTVFRDSRD